MKTFLSLALLALTLGLLPDAARAQYPARPVRLVVPFPAGGASDAAARTIGQALSKSMGQPVVVENAPGANGAIAAQAVLSAPADGYTFLWASASMVALPLMQKATPFESFMVFTPVSMVGRLTFALFVHPGVPARSLAELVAHARANPDKLNYASGTLSEYLAAAQIMKAGGVRMTRVPYKGGAQAMPDLISGRVDLYVTPISLGLPYAKDGRLRLLATLLPKRSVAAPDVPTFAEAGMPGVSVPTWQAIVGPPKLPHAIVERLGRELSRALQDPEVRAQLDLQAVYVEGSTPQALAATVKEDLQAWTQFMRENDIVAE